MSVTLAVDRGARSFGRRAVFTGLDLHLDAGQRLFLRGGNGSGKSTLLRCLAGTLSLSRGSVAVDGRVVAPLGRRPATGVCLHPEQAHHMKLSGHDNLLFAARLRLPGGQVAAAVDAVEAELAMTDYRHQQVQSYSSGMRATLAAARAVVGEPRLLLLDEPTRSMDAAARTRMWDAIERRAVTCVIASHVETDSEHCHRTLDMPVRR